MLLALGTGHLALLSCFQLVLPNAPALHASRCLPGPTDTPGISSSDRLAGLADATTRSSHVGNTKPEGPTPQRAKRPVQVDPARAAREAADQGGEVFQMRWKLTGFAGFLAGLFFPRQGDALISFIPHSEGRIVVQLLITGPKRNGDYYHYGAEIDERAGVTTTVWSSHVFRGDSAASEQDIHERDVLDFASAIHHLRWNPPPRLTHVSIWSGGRIYPAEIRPLKQERRKIGGVAVDVRGFEVRGLRVKGQPSFKDRYAIYFARDARATPVEIVARRGFTKVRIRLKEMTDL